MILLLLLACTPTPEADPRAGAWTGTLELDSGGEASFALTLDITVNTMMDWAEVAATGAVSCGGVDTGAGSGSTTFITADELSITLEGDLNNANWQFYLTGTAEGTQASGNGGLIWAAEGDYSGPEMPSECAGSGEFTADRE